MNDDFGTPEACAVLFDRCARSTACVTAILRLLPVLRVVCVSWEMCWVYCNWTPMTSCAPGLRARSTPLKWKR